MGQNARMQPARERRREMELPGHQWVTAGRAEPASRRKVMESRVWNRLSSQPPRHSGEQPPFLWATEGRGAASKPNLD